MRACAAAIKHSDFNLKLEIVRDDKVPDAKRVAPCTNNNQKEHLSDINNIKHNSARARATAMECHRVNISALLIIKRRTTEYTCFNMQ